MKLLKFKTLLLIISIVLGSSTINGQTLAGWDFSTQAGGAGNFGTSPLAATTSVANASIGSLTRGSGFGTLSGAGVVGAWGSANYTVSGTLAGEITANKFFSFTITPNAGFKVSLSGISAYNIRKSSTGPTTGQWQYQIGSGTFQNIGNAITWGSNTTATGNAQTAIDLSTIPDLQNVTSVITLRLVNYGATNVGGTCYIKDLGNTTGNDLIVNGAVSTAYVAPSISSFSPTTGATGSTVTITGSNFTGVTAVSIGGTAVTSFVVNSDTQITAVVASGSTGAISVMNSNGLTGNSSGTFTFIPAPTITSFTPTNGCTGTTVTISGTGFNGATAFSFGGTAASSFIVNSDTQISAVYGSGSTGNIAVTTPGGSVSSNSNFTEGAAITSYAYVSNQGNNTVSVINTSTNTVTATVNVGNTPSGVSISPDGKKVYVSNGGSNTVSVINTATNTVTSTIAVGSSPYGICVSPDGSKVYVANEVSSNVSVINTATNTVLATVAAGSHPNGISISPDGSKVYVVNWGNNNVNVINTATNTVTATITVGNGPFGVCVSPDGSKAYVTNRNSNTVSVINTATNTVTATVAVGTFPFGISVSPDGSKVYVANQSSNTVSVISTTTNTVTATVAVGTNPFGTSVSPDGTKVYVSNINSNNVSVINAGSNTVTSTVSIGTHPYSFGNMIGDVVSECIPLPTITSFTPTSGGSGTTVTITGTNLVIGGTFVNIGGASTMSNNVVNATTVTAVVGSGATGTISVTTAGGTAVSSGTFTFVPAPTISSFTPTNGSNGNTVTITGTNLTTTTAVSIGGTAASSFIVNSDTQITATIGTGKTGTISVTTLGGTATSTGTFTYNIVSTAGGLAAAITAAGYNLSTMTNLTFTGVIDARDFKTMRDDMPLLAVLDMSGATISAYTGTGGTGGTSSIVYPANEIPQFAFCTTIHTGKISLSSITTPTSSTSIGEYSFENCNGLTGSLVIPNNVTTIGFAAFQGCNGLNGNLTIGNSVVTIGACAFRFCSGLTGSLTIPNSVTTIDAQAFLNCSGFKGALTIGSSVTTIGNSAFYGCSDFTGNLTIPNNVISLGINAFAYCGGLKSLTIGSSVSTIGEGAFLYCVGLSGNLLLPNSVTTIGKGAFNKCGGLTGNLTIPNAVTTIGDAAFMECGGFTGNLTIPNTVTSIGYAAFEYCSGLNGSLAIGNAVSTIGDMAFWGCSNITSVSIPSSLSVIGNDAFFNCTSLGVIYAHPSTPVNIASSADVFYGVNKSTCKLHVPSGSGSLYAAANQWMDFTNISEGFIAPTVTTEEVSTIAGTTATGNGTVTNLGDVNPTQYGVVWSTTTNPDISLSTKTMQGAKSATGAYTSSITGLTPNTQYYVKAYATNGAGTSYGNEVTFTTLALPTITSFTPTNGCTGTTVTITGTGFIGATAVSFGGTAASSFTVVDANTVTAVVGIGTTGTISLTTPGGTAISGGTFTYIPPVVYNVTVPAGTTQCYIIGVATDSTFRAMKKVDDTHYRDTLVTLTPNIYRYSAGPSWAYQELNLASDRIYAANDTVKQWSSLSNYNGLNTNPQGLNLKWASEIGNIQLIRKDSIDNLYVLFTNISNTTNFNPSGNYTLDVANGTQALAKYDVTGKFIWAKNFGNNYLSITDYKISNTGNIYLTGYTKTDWQEYTWVYVGSGFSGYWTQVFDAATKSSTVDVDPSPTASYILNNTNGYDAVLIKFNKDCNFSWAFSIGNSENLSRTETSSGWGSSTYTYHWVNNFLSNALCIDKFENIYIGGSFMGNNDFDPGPGVVSLNNTNKTTTGFYAKYDKNGTYLNSHSYFNNNYSSVNDLAIDNNNNLIVSLDNGYNSATIDLGNGNFSNSNNYYSGCLIKYNENGDFNWNKDFSGNNGCNFNLKINKNNDIFVKGLSSIKFDTNNTKIFKDNSTAIVKYDKNGNYLYGFDTFPNIDQNNNVWINNFDVFDDNVFVYGGFKGNVNFNTATSLQQFSAKGQRDGFISKYSDGNYDFTSTFGLADTYSLVNNLIYTNKGVYASGYGYKDVDIDFSADKTYLIKSNYTTFIARYFDNNHLPTTISSFTPTLGGNGTLVTIKGANLIGTTDVSFGGTLVSSVTVVNDSTVTAIVSTGTTGSISLKNESETATSAGSFTFIPAPIISSFSPTTAASGTVVTITGTNLTGTSAVTIGGTSASSVTVVDANTVTAVVANGTTGTISLTTPGGTATSSGIFSFVPAPTISSFTPTTSGSGATITITGTNLTGATAVSIGGTAASSVTVVNSTTVTAVVGNGTTGIISLTTAGGTATSSGIFSFVPAPTITSFTPTTGATGATVTITGTNLTGASAVSIGGTAASSVSVVNSTTVTAVVGNGTTGIISLTTAGGTAVSSGTFTFIPAPIISSISPISGPTGTEITIKGKYLTGTTFVSFGSPDMGLPFTVISDTTITVTSGLSSGTIFLRTPGGSTIAGSMFMITYPPTITWFTPSIGGNGTTITINGTNFNGTSSVTIGGIAASSFTVVDNTTITATVANGSTGTISVTNQDGTATSGDKFTFVAAPIISSFSPTSGMTGTEITIKGKYLTGTTFVTIGNSNMSLPFTVTSDTTITVFSGNTSGNIRLTTPGGVTSIGDIFTVLNRAVINSYSPISGSAGTVITITGSNLTGTSSVTIGGIAASSFTVLNDATVTATVGNGASGSIYLTTPASTEWVGTFTYIPPVSGVTYSVTVPVGTNACYIAGTMNVWAFQAMTKVDATHYTVNIASATASDTYKYCSGPNWAYQEKDANGYNINNRTYAASDVVANWAFVYNPLVQPTDVVYNVTVPSGTNACYINGAASNWQFTAMTKLDATHYTITLNTATPDAYQYCSGPDWTYRELDANQHQIADRIYTSSDVVQNWASVFAPVYGSNYTITFSGSAAASSAGDVLVENLTQGTTVTVPAGNVLYLYDNLSTQTNQLNSDKESIVVYPNGIQGSNTLSFYSKQSGYALVNVFSIDGQKITGINQQLQEGQNSFRLSLKKGAYIVQVVGNGYSYSTKMLNLTGTEISGSMEYIGNEKPAESSPQKMKSVAGITSMLYHAYDQLLFKAVSGNFSTIITDVPYESKNINFEFIACQDADGNYYTAVTIGTQTWMAENLRTTKYRTGETVPNVTDATVWSTLFTGAWCDNANNPLIGVRFGHLYNYASVADPRNIAPVGWHVATDAEWTTLSTYLGGGNVAGGKLKETGTVDWLSPNAGATNQSGFNALAGGGRSYDGTFGPAGYGGGWWSSTPVDITTAWGWKVVYNDATVAKYPTPMSIGGSVRCVKDVNMQITIPVLTTLDVTLQGSNTASGGGNISSDGGASVLVRGLCWGTTPTPTIGGFGTFTTSDGSGAGSFSSSLSALNLNQNYYVRAYATNSVGTAYGNEVMFMAQAIPPSQPITNAISAITSSTASGGGSFTMNGNIVSIMGQGICWSTSPNPTITDSKTSDVASSGTFTSSMTGLTAGTTYYVRAYISSYVTWTGTSGSWNPITYGNEVSFTVAASQPANTVTDIDGNVYHTVIIGTQTWMVENLKTTKYRNGDAIPSPVGDWSALTSGAQAAYNNDAANATKFGLLYNWYAVADTRNITPTGWHVPTDVEWTTLTTYLGGEVVAGGKLKEIGTLNWTFPNTGATNETGFYALPGGDRFYDGTFFGIGYYGYWWSASESSTSYAWINAMYANYSFASKSSNVKQIGYSVRCIKD
ncbi:MAG: FISUMP domain-containing protein [Paludibacter sp.]